MNDFIPKLRYEDLIRKVCGENWKSLPDNERQGALGVAIVKSVLDGVKPDLHDVSRYLGVDVRLLSKAWQGLVVNGVFTNGRLDKDRKDLNSEDIYAWCYYAGYASNVVGK